MTIKTWPNGLGATLTSGRAMFEVWRDGRVDRVVKDDSLCGFHGTHYIRFNGNSIDALADQAIRSWKDDRASWTPCD